jgi:hypothetical protein
MKSCRHPSFGLDIMALLSTLLLILRVIKIGVEKVARAIGFDLSYGD